MIHLGLDATGKADAVARYCAAHGIRKVVVLTPERLAPPAVPAEVQSEVVRWDEIILYRFYYRLLREIDPSHLVVVNELLRIQQRHDLTYNCTRLYLQQTPHRLIFQGLPIIDTLADFGVLFDFETRSQWKREPVTVEVLRRAEIHIEADLTPSFGSFPVQTSGILRETYAREKRALIDGIGLRDPHTIPRTLLLMAGRAKLPHIVEGRHYLGRNNRFKLPLMHSYRDAEYADEPHDVFEFPHDFVRMADVVSLLRRTEYRALVSDLKVDGWYFQRFREWGARIADAYAVIRESQDRR